MTKGYKLRLNWLWRLIMTGSCFAGFGIGGLFLSFIWFKWLCLIQKNPLKRQQSARKSICWCFKAFLTTAKRLGVLDYAIENQEYLKQDKGLLIVANHPTLIDYVLLASVLPETDCLVKAALLHNPFFKRVIQTAGYLVNQDAPTLLASSQDKLRQNQTILIFPEGTRTTSYQDIKLQRGAANIAVHNDCAIRVALISCSENTLGKQSKWYHIPAAKPVFTVTVQKNTILARDFLAKTPHSKPLAARQLTSYLTTLFTDHTAKHYEKLTPGT